METQKGLEFSSAKVMDSSEKKQLIKSNVTTIINS